MQAAYRGATAALRLKEFDRAHNLCTEALNSVSGDSDLSKLQEVGQQGPPRARFQCHDKSLPQLHRLLQTVSVSEDLVCKRAHSAALQANPHDHNESLHQNVVPSTSNAAQTIAVKRTAAQQAKQKEDAKQLAASAPSKQLARALLERGWQIAAPQASVGELLLHRIYIGHTALGT